MPRTPAQDTPAQRELKVMSSVVRRLDDLGKDSLDRVITWIDGLVDGDSETAEAEIKAMRTIAGQFDAIEDKASRERIVRYLNDHYARPVEPADGPHPL